MRMLAPVALALLLTTIEAQAGCMVISPGSAWDGAERSTARTLCLERELSQSSEALADQMRWKIELGTFSARTELLLQQQRAATGLNDWFR